MIGGISAIGLLMGKPITDLFTIGVSLAVAAIPEGLPIVVTVTLALGVMRMAEKRAVVKKLPAVEALVRHHLPPSLPATPCSSRRVLRCFFPHPIQGCASVLCVDKTGTLTKNEMTVVEMYSLAEPAPVRVSGGGYSSVGDVKTASGERVTKETHPHVALLAEIGSVCNNSSVDNGVAVGQATEAALLVAADKLQGRVHHTQFHRSYEKPFSSDDKWMAVRGRFVNTGSLTRIAPQSGTGATEVAARLAQASHTAEPRGDDAGGAAVPGEAYFVKGAVEAVLQR